MVAYSLCDGCEQTPPEHCLGTADRHVPQELLDQGFCGGFICSCECAKAAREALQYLKNLDTRLGIDEKGNSVEP